jgi:hypothetical protein
LCDKSKDIVIDSSVVDKERETTLLFSGEEIYELNIKNDSNIRIVDRKPLKSWSQNITSPIDFAFFWNNFLLLFNVSQLF